MRKLIIALFLTVLGVSYARAQTSAPISQSEQGKAGKPDQGSKAEQEVTIKAPLVVKLEATPKTDAELKQAAAERDEGVSFNRKSLLLSGSYVRATWILVIIGGLTVLAYAIQCGLLISTLRQTGKNSRNALRAYVQIVPHSMFGVHVPNKLESGPLKVNLRAENFGQTPAIGLNLRCGYFVAHNLPLGKNYSLPKLSPVSIESLDIFPNSSVADDRKLKILVTQNWNPPQEEWDAIHSGDRTIYIFGRGGYRDMFGKNEHVLEFCFALSYPDGITNALANHNITTTFPVDGSIADIGNRIA